jgi:hypothetical protein
VVVIHSYRLLPLSFKDHGNSSRSLEEKKEERRKGKEEKKKILEGGNTTYFAICLRDIGRLGDVSCTTRGFSRGRFEVFLFSSRSID